MMSANALRALIVVAVAAAVAACSSSGPSLSLKRVKEYFSERDYGKASPRVAYGAVPKGGGRVVVGDAYRVAGKTYVPTTKPRYSEVGLASWYGDAFHGRLTANGEVYDVNGLTAAHPTLPLPSYARVTNLENGRSIIVRVNDRGPFAHDRIIDLSSRVADMLAMKDEGTARVQVDYVGPARMDGLDEKTLLASYRGPADGPGGSAFAWLKPKTPPVVLAAAPLPRARPDLTAAYQGAGSQGPLMLAPAYAQPDDDDPIAPLIIRSSFVNSYAEDATLSPAQHAVAALATSRFVKPDLQAALSKAAARKALELRGTSDEGVSIVQLGIFADPGNAAKIANDFGRFGRVTSALQPSGDHALTVVRVAVEATISPSAVVDAAMAAGLDGAFIVTH